MSFSRATKSPLVDKFSWSSFVPIASAPQKFECSVVSEDLGTVSFDTAKFYTTTFLNTFYIYTVAEENKEGLSVFSSIGSPLTIDKDIKLKLAEKTGVSHQEIQQIKSFVGAPSYYHKEKLLTSSCSISHHGNYGAFAFTFIVKAIDSPFGDQEIEDGLFSNCVNLASAPDTIQ